MSLKIWPFPFGVHTDTVCMRFGVVMYVLASSKLGDQLKV